MIEHVDMANIQSLTKGYGIQATTKDNEEVK
jgi:hypothetical protein